MKNDVSYGDDVFYASSFFYLQTKKKKTMMKMMETYAYLYDYVCNDFFFDYHLFAENYVYVFYGDVYFLLKKKMTSSSYDYLFYNPPFYLLLHLPFLHVLFLLLYPYEKETLTLCV